MYTHLIVIVCEGHKISVKVTDEYNRLVPALVIHDNGDGDRSITFYLGKDELNRVARSLDLLSGGEVDCVEVIKEVIRKWTTYMTHS
mgnify:CR=1 FL=1